MVKGFENVDFQEIIGYGINGITLRNDSPLFDDLKVRQAVNYAVDIDAIMTNIVRDTGIRARNTAVPPDMLGSAANELEPVPMTLEQAKQLMAESSQPNGFSTKLAVVASSPVWLPQAIAVQEASKS